MRAESNFTRRAGNFIFLGALLLGAPAPAQTLTNVNVRVMAANTSSGNFSSYEWPGINIFKALKPDVVAIQEFKYNNSTTPAQLRQLVDIAFGTNFHYFRENYTAGPDIPNGIISRWPILDSGSWDDPVLANRGFAWAQIDLPGTNDLYVVSVHLYSTGSATDRNTEATIVKTNIQFHFPSNAWVIVGGDLNTGSRSEAAVNTFKTFLSDNPIPTDAEIGGDADTNEPRSSPYDYLLPSFSLTNLLTNVVVGSRSFPKGLVFDSEVYTNLSEVAPVIVTDSHTNGMQHMAVIKDFRITYYLTNTSVIAPVITNQPQAQAVSQGASATFSVTAGGTPPLGYQWRFNGGNIGGATNSAYTRTNVQPSHVGIYSVVVSGSGTFATSSNAGLSLIVPRPLLTTPYPGVVRWQGLSNLSYAIEFRTNLSQTNWQLLTQLSSPNNTITFSNLPIVGTQRFYRVSYP
jgi:endonuclease/exonuclease/phosphatase (EEP) superfamily protein YafD